MRETGLEWSHSGYFWAYARDSFHETEIATEIARLCREIRCRRCRSNPEHANRWGELGPALMNPPILNDPINGSERGEFEQHSGEAFDQWPQAELWHHWYEVVEHGALTKQGVGTLF